jgi:hypothetical protein
VSLPHNPAIKIFELRLQDKCWFDCRKTIGKYKGTTITKACVSELAWNKQGNDLIAIGTTSGYVLVYEATNAYKNIMQIKGHDGTGLSMQATSTISSGTPAPGLVSSHLPSRITSCSGTPGSLIAMLPSTSTQKPLKSAI